jgi:hypothetical protein
MPDSVYLETSVISYLTSRPSRDVVTAGNQRATVEWWNGRRHDFELVVSDAVVDEISGGDARQARKRLAWIQGIRVLRTGSDEEGLAKAIALACGLPPRAALDALHIAITAVQGVRYLLTWNCAHIANAALRPRIESACSRSGRRAPVICTPPELM